MSKNIFLSLFIVITGFFYAQEKTYKLEWEKVFVASGESKYEISQIKDCGLDNGLPFLFISEEIKKANYIVEIKNEVFIEMSVNEIKHLKSLGYQPSNQIQWDKKVTMEAFKPLMNIYAIPIVVQNGVWKKLTSFTAQLITVPSVPKEKDFVANSVLQDGSGDWYKISIQKDGIYKIDKSFLSDLGVNVAQINPQHINIYGNGSGILPELNSLPRIDDLAKNAIIVSGEADGVFNDNDYILFYGGGPHRWDANGLNDFDQKRNVYSDYSYYFININPNNTPARVQDAALITQPSDTLIDSYHFRDIYENDLVSLVNGGQRWYGELFDVELERTFSFSVPNIDTAAVNFKTAIASNAAGANGTSQNYYANGVLLSSSALPSSGGVDYSRSTKAFSWSNPTSSIAFKVAITRNSPSVLTYLDRIVLNTKRKLVFYSTQFGFRSLMPTRTNNYAQYSLSSFPANGFVWDISDRNNPKKVSGNLSSGVYSFVDAYAYKEFYASNGTSFFTPEKVGKVVNQNLHGLPQADYLIVSHPDFLSQANRLADLHREEGLTVNVVTTEQVFNEFSSGATDACAIRMYAKMFYDRAATNTSLRPKYLLLFGDGTYDPKNRVANNNNFVVTYQVDNSENHISALVTDDFYGMLDDNEAISSTDMLDIGIVRILASDITQATQQVNKIEHYMKNGSSLFATQGSSCCLGANNAHTFGDWRQKFVQIADDEENGYFIYTDTEPQYKWVKSNHREMNCDKLYMDAFPQVATAGGERYPDVYDAITDRVQRGSLLVNYVGHGGEVGLAEERVVTIPQIQSWSNINALNLFVSATCEFTKYDDPSRVSAGEWAALNPTGGAIALMTTTRSVYFGVNSNTGTAFYKNVFERDANGKSLTFGEIVRRTKNQAGNSDNKRSFTLIGDPALHIALPQYKVVTDSINGLVPTVQVDTMQALSHVRIAGHLEDFSGNPMNTFNGTVIPSIFDKIKVQSTLGQDPNSPVINYELQKSIVYRGKASVVNGRFAFDFVVPKDIALSIGNGKISYYAFNDHVDAGGYDTLFYIGGIDPNGIADNEGPTVEMYMNDEKFVNGSVTDESPVLLIKAYDENGINTVGNGIGHDILGVLDGDVAHPISLNDYYSSNLDDYKRGEIRYQLTGLTKGKHSMEIKIWDVNNNSSSAKVDFEVVSKTAPELDHVYNYPNPFTTHTSFMFEHNQSCNNLDVQIQVYTISGKLVKSIQQQIPTQGFRSEGISWDGKDEFGDQLAKGVYVYRLKVKNTDGQTAEKTEKLVILR